MARNVKFSFLRGGGSSLEVLYGKVSLTPTNLHTLSSTAVLPAPTTFDLVNGTALATNVAPTPAPVGGLLPWGYKVKITDNFGKSWEYLVGVPDGTTEINFNVLPRYSETRPPAFGVGPAGPAGQSATIAIGTTTSGPTPAVTNTGTSTDAVLNFTLAQGPQGVKGDGVTVDNTKLFSDPPTSYSAGVTTTNATTANGWPTGFMTVVTEVARSNDRAIQTMVNVEQTFYAQRVAQNSEWRPLKQIAYDDLASPLKNGLMPALDKAKLDGMTPAANSKTFAALASTYQTGFSTLQVRAADGWPVTTTGTVVTQKTATGNGGVAQWLYAVEEGAAPQYRVSDAAGNWLPFQAVADPSTLVSRGDYGIAAKDYGAVGDGVANDYWGIRSAITASRGRTVYLEGGKTYRIAGTLEMPTNSNTVKLVALGPEPATLFVGASGQSYSPIKFEQNTVAATTTLTARMRLGSNGWAVASTEGIQPGMLCEVVSDALWYFDPRPGEGEAHKSELHKVRSVEGNKVYFVDPANDGYSTAGEATTLTFYQPIKVHLENLLIQGTLPAPAETTSAILGVVVTRADSPQFINVSTDSCARAGIYIQRSYAPYVEGGYSARSNNFFNGYGVSTSGTAHALVRDRFTYESRRGIDFSGSTVISRNSRAINCTTVGGGRNSRGEEYSWPEAGGYGAAQFGFGTHGPSDGAEYISCTTIGVMHPYSLRGRDERIVDFRHIGRTSGGIVRLSYGTNVFIEGGLATGGNWSYKTLAGGGELLAPDARPDGLVRLYGTYQTNPPASTQRGRVIVKGVTAELQSYVMRVEDLAVIAYPLGHVTISDCDISVWTTGTFSTIYMATDTDTINKSRTFIGPNRITNDSSTGVVQLSNRSLAGANVLDYTVST